ncbi:hypothetical protein P7C70_g2101, partial [Phenoliferia sp. Uapishka_3]
MNTDGEPYEVLARTLVAKTAPPDVRVTPKFTLNSESELLSVMEASSSGHTDYSVLFDLMRFCEELVEAAERYDADKVRELGAVIYERARWVAARSQADELRRWARGRNIPGSDTWERDLSGDYGSITDAGKDWYLEQAANEAIEELNASQDSADGSDAADAAELRFIEEEEEGTRIRRAAEALLMSQQEADRQAAIASYLSMPVNRVLRSQILAQYHIITKSVSPSSDVSFDSVRAAGDYIRNAAFCIAHRGEEKMGREGQRDMAAQPARAKKLVLENVRG